MSTKGAKLERQVKFTPSSNPILGLFGEYRIPNREPVVQCQAQVNGFQVFSPSLSFIVSCMGDVIGDARLC